MFSVTGEDTGTSIRVPYITWRETPETCLDGKLYRCANRQTLVRRKNVQNALSSRVFCSKKCWGKYRRGKISISQVLRLLEEGRTLTQITRQMHTSNPTLRSVLGEKLAPNYMAAYKDTLRIGTDFELRTQSFFASQGYFVVRSAESRGPADLVCLRLDEILLIQCKGGVGRIHDAERIRLIKVAEMIHAKAMLAQEGGDGAVLLTELKH